MRALRITRSAASRPAPWSIRRASSVDRCGHLAASVEQSVKVAEVDVGAAHEHADAPAGQPLAQWAEQGGGGRGAGRLQGQLQRVEAPGAWRRSWPSSSIRTISSTNRRQSRSCRAARTARPGCRRWSSTRSSAAGCRRRSCATCCPHPRLDAEDQAVRAQLLDRAGHAGQQPAAADRHDDRVEIGRLLEPFEATVPVPRAVSGPSNGWTNARPSSRRDPLGDREALGDVGHHDQLRAVAARPATRAGLAVASITTFAWVPSSRAAQAVAIAWLPALTAVTPRASASGGRLSMTASAPRALNEPVCWNSSSLRLTLVPAGMRARELRAVPVQHRRADDPAGSSFGRGPDLGQRRRRYARSRPTGSSVG